MRSTATKLVVTGKGILAADESPETFGKRVKFLPNKLGTRRHWRKVLLTTRGIHKYLSGMIFHEEIVSSMHAAEEMKAARHAGIQMGVKLDQGLTALAPGSTERVTKGLDGLDKRCTLAQLQKTTFSKWRAVYRIDLPHGLPSPAALKRNAKDLAKYAEQSQRCGLVPVLEPEVLAAGAHSLEQAVAEHTKVLAAVFSALRAHKAVDMAAAVLKTAFVTPGTEHEPATPEAVANATMHVLLHTVPPMVPGVVFLSGGLGEQEASSYLLAVVKVAQAMESVGQPLPWKLSFSFGRGLQTSAWQKWGQGDQEAGQQAFLERARVNALATEGEAA